MTIPSTWDDWPPWLAARAGELKTAMVFLTRLPVPGALPAGGLDIAAAVWAFPLVGVVVGLSGAVVYALAHHLGLPPWPAAALAVAATLAITGALHEDGLADTADGFGGGKTREQKLDIMRDSRIGTYGVCALILSLVLRTGALASLAEPGAVAAALIAAHAGARAVVPAVMLFLAPARHDGLSFAAGAPSAARAAAAAILGVVILFISLGLVLTIAAAVVVVIAAALMSGLSERQIGGQTGDVLGAVEQLGEIAILLVALR